MEARYMVSYFACNNSDYDVEDVSNRPLAAHLTLIAGSQTECGFKVTSTVKSAHTISKKRIFHYVKTKE